MINKNTSYKEFFKDKKITIIGLGLLGRGIGDAVFLAECGAKLTITDLKTKAELKESLKKLNKFRNIKYVLGKHDLEDFKNADFILKAAGVPIDSIFIKEARKHKVPIEMDVSFFAKFAQGVKIVGVTGTRGKSMTTALIYQILSKNIKDREIFLGGNVRGVATLPLLKKSKAGDILVCELDSWQLQGFGDSKISPNIAVFTSFMPDHMNYYKNSMKNYFADKANIFKYQKKVDVLIIRPDMKKLIPKNIKSKLIMVNKKDVAGWKFNVLGDHHKENLACAVAVAKTLGVPIQKIKASVAKFSHLEGRMQQLPSYKGIKIYNDNNATTPKATIAGIEALSQNFKNKKIILICGGNDKGLELKSFSKVLDRYCKLIITIPGTGTDRLFNTKFESRIMGTKNLKEAVKVAHDEAVSGDILLFSPGFSSFSQYSNEYERGDEFIKLIKKWK